MKESFSDLCDLTVNGEQEKFQKTFNRIFFLILSLHGFTQTDSLISRVRTSSNLLFSCNSSLIYPGIRIGIEIPVNSVNLTKNTNTGRSKSIIKDLFNRVSSTEKKIVISPVSGHNIMFQDEVLFCREINEFIAMHR